MKRGKNIKLSIHLGIIMQNNNFYRDWISYKN